MDATHLPRELARWLAEPDAHVGRSLPLPGDAWQRRLLVALADHVERQLWVARIVEEHLSADPRGLASDGAFGHPENLPQQGAVPDLPGWSYFFHGIGCCLTHVDGTSIDVDFDGRGGDGIDPYFFGRYLATAAAPTRVDALLRRPEPFEEAWMVDLDGLHDGGLIESRHRFRLTEQGHRWAAALGPVVHEMLAAEPARRQQLALALGDLELASGPDLPPLAPGWLDARQTALGTRAGWLERGVDRGERPALLALALVDRERARERVMRIVTSEPVSGLTSRALALLEAWGPPFDESLLLSLAQRASLESRPPHPYIRARCLDLVLQGYRENTLPDSLRQRMLAMLSLDGHAMEETVAMLHFLLDPPAGLARLGRALRHDTPLVVQEVAACLVVIGTPDALALLSTTGDDEAQLALTLARGDEPDPPGRPVGETILWRGQPRQVYTFDELMASRLPAYMRDAIERARETWGPRLARWWAS